MYGTHQKKLKSTTITLMCGATDIGVHRSKMVYYIFIATHGLML